MTPRSLMALASVLLVAQVAAAAAVGGWMQVTAGSQTLFIQKDAHDQLKAGAVGGQRKLLAKPGGEDSGYVLLKKAANVLVVKKGSTELGVKEVKAVAAAPAKQPSKAAAQTPPAPLDPAAVVKNDADVPADKKDFVVSVLQKLKTERPDEYRRMLAGGDKAVQSVAQRILWAQKTEPADAAVISGRVGRKLPNGASMMTAALDEAGAPAFVPVPEKPDTVKGIADPQANDPQNAAKNKTLINVLADAIRSNEAAARADLSKRFIKLLLEDGDYVAKKVRDDKQLRKSVEGFVEAWTKQVPLLDIINLYAVAGAPDAPAWIQDAGVRKVLAEAPNQAKLKEVMSPWTKPGAQGAPGQLQQGSRDEVAAFFSSDSKDQKNGGASFWAAKIIANEGRDWHQIAGAIAARAEPDGVPGQLPGSGGPTQRDPSVSYGFASLYETGAKVWTVWGPGDKASRKISVKLYAVREGDTVITKIGVWDITDPSNVFGQNFPVRDSGSRSFSLDDRIPGYPKYTLNFTPTKDGDSVVSLGREGAPEGHKGTLQTSLNDLFEGRAAQVRKEGSSVEINGRRFLTIGQGGHPGGVAFFAAGDVANARRGDRIEAELFAGTTRREHGRDVSIPGKQGLGKVNGKDYHLVYNPQMRYWEIGDGPGDAPPKPNKDETPAGDDKQAGNTQQPGRTPQGGERTEADVLAQERSFELSGEYERNTEVREGLSEQYKDVIRVYSWKKASPGGEGLAARPIAERHVLVVPKAISAKRVLHAPFLEGKNDNLIRKKGEIRGIGKYLATSNDIYTAYFDVSKPHPSNPNLVFDTDLKCIVNMGDKSWCVRDLVLLPDAAKMTDFPEDAVKVVHERAAKLIGKESEYWIRRGWDAQNNAPGPVVAQIRNVGTCTIYPDLKPCSNVVDPAHQNTENKSVGPAHAFDKLTIGPDSEISTDSQTVDHNGQKITLTFAKMNDAKTAGLYADGKDFPKAKVWYLTFKIKLRDGVTGRTGYIPVFDADVPNPGLDKLRYKGLEITAKRENAPDIRMTGTVRKAIEKGNAKGVYYVVEEKNITQPDSQNKYPNCVGPVLWWGMDEAAATKVCQENGSL